MTGVMNRISWDSGSAEQTTTLPGIMLGAHLPTNADETV